MRQALTAVERKLFDYIAKYIETHKMGPRAKDIMGYMGWSSLGTLDDAVADLERKHWITREWHKHRSIRIRHDRDGTYGMKPVGDFEVRPVY